MPLKPDKGGNSYIYDPKTGTEHGSGMLGPGSASGRSGTCQPCRGDRWHKGLLVSSRASFASRPAGVRFQRPYLSPSSTHRRETVPSPSLAMAICGRCSLAIKKLNERRPGSERSPKNYVSLPRYRRSTVESCWICYRIRLWLEAEHPKLFKTWHTRRLRVQFRFFARIGLIDQPGNILLPLFFTIIPAGYDGDELGCEMELNFVPAKGHAAISSHSVEYLLCT